MTENQGRKQGVPARISLVTLGVADLGRQTEFYRKLGWSQVLPAEDDVSFFRTAGGILSLYAAAELAADAAVPPQQRPTGEVRSGIAIAINVESPEEVDAALSTAEAAGARITKPAQKVFWGGYSGYFADPEGNLWEVAHNPFWPLDERGLPVLRADGDGEGEESEI